MKKIVLGVFAALTLAGACVATVATAHNMPTCMCDQFGCVCQ